MEIEMAIEMKKKIDYSSIDPNIRDLVRVINSFDEFITIESCGGHTEPLSEGQWSENDWYVEFEVTSDDNGWVAFQFLMELINGDRLSGVFVLSKAAGPYLNRNSPEMMLPFMILGNYCCDPQELAKFIKQVKRECYKPTKNKISSYKQLPYELTPLNML